MPTSQIKCYNVTVLQPIHWLKTRKKYFNYHKLFCCVLKMYVVVTLMRSSYAPSTNRMLRCYSVTADKCTIIKFIISAICGYSEVTVNFSQRNPNFSQCYPNVTGGGRVVRWSWVNFQCRGVLQFGYSRARAYCACSRCGWGLFGHFYSPVSFSSHSPSLWEMTRYRLKYCLKGPLNPNQPTKTLMLQRFQYILNTPN